MIFVTVGSQKFQFDRLLESIDKQIENNQIHDEVFAQIGYSNYIPKNYGFSRFLNREEFQLNLLKCDLVITHGGTGAIMTGLLYNKKVIAIARLKEYKEHVDNHQLQIIDTFLKQNLICGVDNCDNLYLVIEKIKNIEFDKYKSKRKEIIESIDNFIKSCI